jgi:hypothetical protein
VLASGAALTSVTTRVPVLSRDVFEARLGMRERLPWVLDGAGSEWLNAGMHRADRAVDIRRNRRSSPDKPQQPDNPQNPNRKATHGEGHHGVVDIVGRLHRRSR